MDRGHPVRAVRAHDGEIRHADVLCGAFLDQARPRDAAFVSRKTAPHVIEQSAVDLEDDLEVARQQHLEPLERPFFEGFGQKRVVRVRQRPLGQVPGLVPSEVRVVEQDSHQLGDGDRRMGIVELDGGPFGKRAPVGVAAAESSDQIRQRAGDEKVLLHEPQLLPLGRRVVGIEDPCERFSRKRLRQRADELAMTERLEIEVEGRGRRPEAEGVNRLAAIAHHGPIEGNAEQRERPAGDRAQRPVSHLDRVVQPDLDLLFRTNDLPRVGAAKPVVRLLVLPAVLDGLLEHSVFVAEAIPHRRQLHRGHRVEKTRRQTPEAAISQPGVGFLLEQAEPIERRLLDRFTHEGAEQQIGDVVGQRTADQEFHREVVDALRIFALVGLLRADPSLREDVSHGARERLVALPQPGGCRIGDVVEEQVPLVERLGVPRELDRAASILPAERSHGVR